MTRIWRIFTNQIRVDPYNPSNQWSIRAESRRGGTERGWRLLVGAGEDKRRPKIGVTPGTLPAVHQCELSFSKRVVL
jgi:hypothetical protein